MAHAPCPPAFFLRLSGRTGRSGGTELTEETLDIGSRERLWVACALFALMLVAALATVSAYWPGLMTWDSVRQYGQALDGQYDDWHPPAMNWLWRQLTAIHSGPAAMLVLQVALYWIGFALMAARALVDRRPGLAAGLTACGLMPLSLALMGAVLKDCLMAGVLSCALGLFLFASRDAQGRTGRWLRALALVLILLSATLRFNAFTACLPLVLALLPAAFRNRPWRLIGSAIVATAVLMAAMPIANRLLDAKPSGVALSLVIFDLGGITEHGGRSVFPPIDGVDHPVAANHACYTPVKWDSYSYWVQPECPLGFEPFQDAMEDSPQGATRIWIGAILAHPIAYAEHRWAHFNINTRFLVHDEIERPVQVVSAPNDWGYATHPGTLLAAIDAAAVASAHTPLAWPIVWIAIALGTLILAPRLPSRGLIVPIALSALLYGLGYAVFSVAAELRYHLWTMMAAAIALVLTIGDLAIMPALPRRRIVGALAPAMLVTALAILWRLAPGL